MLTEIHQISAAALLPCNRRVRVYSAQCPAPLLLSENFGFETTAAKTRDCIFLILV
jgi:hypothetical protein